LQEYGKTLGEFDIVIDDGSHMAKETMNCFINLWPYLNNGGWYIIEDWGACYRTYTDAGNPYSGMDNIISNILLSTREYGISGIEIILGGKEGTYAAFKKR
jgi:hypothetical protein